MVGTGDPTPISRQGIVEPDPLEDTHPTQALHPTTRLEPGAYDHLFPPAQPGDEDYLEATPPGDLTTPDDGEPPSTPGDLPL
jgi:hypothetical protein